jgi:hypothetical protein
MPKFPQPLDIRKTGKRQWTLLAPFMYETESDVFKTGGAKTLITVPVGFDTDFASIPRAFWRVFPPVGEYDGPAVIHDYLYRTQTCDRATADLVFYEAMLAIGVPKWKAWTMYRAVQSCGWATWRKHTKAIAAKSPVHIVNNT